MIRKFEGRLTGIHFLNIPSILLIFFALKRESDRNSLVTSKSSGAVLCHKVVHYADSVILI